MGIEAWQETQLGDLVQEPRGFQNGPFGNELRASEYVRPSSSSDRGTRSRAPVAGFAAGEPEDDVPVIMPRDLVDGSVSTVNAARILPEKAAQLEKYRVRPGDVLVGRRGEIGRCALMTDVEDGWVCGTGCLRVRLRNAIDPRFFVQYLRWHSTVTWLERNAVGQTMPSLNTRILARIPIRLPPLWEQRRIVAVLESADRALRRGRALVEQTRRVRDLLLRQILVPQRSGSGSESDLPPGWTSKPLGELCTLTNGRRYNAADWSDAGLPIIRIQNLNGSREFKRFAGYAKPGWIVEEGELLFAWAGQRGVSFGPCIWAGPRGVLNQHIFRVRPEEGVSKVWLYETLRLVTREIENKAHGFKASLVHVRKSDMTGQPVVVPPAARQEAIAERSRQLGVRVALEESAVESLQTMRQGLRHDLFAERVRCRRHRIDS